MMLMMEDGEERIKEVFVNKKGQGGNTNDSKSLCQGERGGKVKSGEAREFGGLSGKGNGKQGTERLIMVAIMSRDVLVLSNV